MSGVSIDGRDRRDRGPCWCPYRVLTLMEWRSRGLGPVSGARARLSAGRGRRHELDPVRMEKSCRPRPVGMWISAHFPTYPQAQQQEER